MEIYGAALNTMKLSRMVYFIVMSKISMEFHASVTKSLLCDLGFFAQTSIQKKSHAYISAVPSGTRSWTKIRRHIVWGKWDPFPYPS